MGNNILPEVEPYGSLFFLHHYKGITKRNRKFNEIAFTKKRAEDDE